MNTMLVRGEKLQLSAPFCGTNQPANVLWLTKSELSAQATEGREWPQTVSFQNKPKISVEFLILPLMSLFASEEPTTIIHPLSDHPVERRFPIPVLVRSVST